MILFWNNFITPTTSYDELCEFSKTNNLTIDWFTLTTCVAKGNGALIESALQVLNTPEQLSYMDWEGKSLLHWACRPIISTDGEHLYVTGEFQFAIAKKLIQLGSPIDLTQKRGDSACGLNPLEYAISKQSTKIAIMLCRLGGIFRLEKYPPEWGETWTLVKQNCMTRQEKQFKCSYELDCNCTLKIFPKEIIEGILLISSKLLRDEEELDVRYT